MLVYNKIHLIFRLKKYILTFCRNYFDTDMEFKIFINEHFKEVHLHPSLKLRYAVSNLGRFISFTQKIEDGHLVKGSTIKGYRIFRYKVREEGEVKHKHLFFYKLVAELFLNKPTEEHVFVLHLDRNRNNDAVGNLKWATKTEMLAYSKASPFVIEAKKKLVEHNIRRDGHKLTATQVMFIKKRLSDPNRKTRNKILAKQFGISEMQLHRIKTGENWGHIKV